MHAAEKLQFTAVEHLLQSYLLENLVRPATSRTYEQVVKRWIEETEIFCVEAVTRDDVLNWRNGILARARPETWNKYRRHMRALFNYAITRGWIATNVFSSVPPARTGLRLKKLSILSLSVRHLPISKLTIRICDQVGSGQWSCGQSISRASADGRSLNCAGVT
jgi:Site-specific recombinase XerD